MLEKLAVYIEGFGRYYLRQLLWKLGSQSRNTVTSSGRNTVTSVGKEVTSSFFLVSQTHPFTTPAISKEEKSMLRTKMMFLTVVIVALAVPSLWGQKARLVRPQAAANGPAVCTVNVGNPLPGYTAETNKCSSGNNSNKDANGDPMTCSDKGGVEAAFDTPALVAGIDTALGKNGWPNWLHPSVFAGIENDNPPVYRESINIQTSIGVTTTQLQGVLGLEVDDLNFHTYLAEFSGPSVKISSGTFPVGGKNINTTPGAVRIAAVCSGPAINRVVVTCQDCTTDVSKGKGAVAQIRGDNFKGF